jgi:integrase
MPKKISSALSDLKIKTAKPTEKPYKLFDGEGLFLFVSPSGGKLWRVKYRFGGIEKTLSIGKYPQNSLLDARQKLFEIKKKVENGIDPSDEKKAEKAERIELTENTFKNIAMEWHEKSRNEWTPGHAETIMSRLENNVFQMIGERPIKHIKAKEVLGMLRIIESRGAVETAHRVKTICSQIFRYAVASDKAESDPTVFLKGALKAVTQKHHAAIIEPDQIGGLLRAIDSYSGTFTVLCALKLAPMLFVRPGELRQAEWIEFDLEAGLWTIPKERMKMRISHIVPLSRQAVQILKELHPFTCESKYVFPSPRTNSRPMSNNAVLSAL